MPEINEGLFTVMRRLDGAKFKGHLTTATAVSTKEKAPYRVLLARKPTFLVPGDTVRSHDTEVVILMDHPDDFGWAKSFKAVFAQQTYDWYRPATIIDPVAGIPRGNGKTSMGKLYVNFDSAEEFRFEGFQDTEYRFITGQPILVNDYVGPYRIKKIVEMLGVKIAVAA